MPACGKGSSKARPAGSITVVSYGGGAYQDSHRKAFCEPFSLYTGMAVDSIAWNSEYGKLKAMVTEGRVSWDAVEVTAAQFQRGKREGLFAELTVTPEEGEFLPGSVTAFGVANVYWGTVLGYRKAAFLSQKPSTWADFFDVDRFPGARAMYDDPRANLEFALLADGVPKDGLYPLDIERAFRKLDHLKPHVRVWWSDGTQPVQLLLTEVVALSTVWNGRIFASEQAKKELGYTWDGAALELDYWVVPRGSTKVDAASRFIAFASAPHQLAVQAAMIGYGPVNKSALALIRPDVRSQLPTEPANWDQSFVVDAQWWEDNEAAVKSRWLQWKSQ